MGLSLKGKNEGQRKKCKMVEENKTNPTGKSTEGSSSDHPGPSKSENISKDSFTIRDDGIKIHKVPEGGWGEYPPTRTLHDFCNARCIKKPTICLIDADGEAHAPVFTFQAKCFYLGSYIETEAIHQSKR